MADVNETLLRLLRIDGCLGACIVDGASGRSVGSTGGIAVDPDVAAAGSTEVLRVKRRTLRALRVDDAIEDVLITLDRAYHLIRPLPSSDEHFVYLVLDKTRASLAVARHHLRLIEKDLEL